MRVQIELLPENINCSIPINYQYHLAAAVYNIIGTGNFSLMESLHNADHPKFYTFSNFIIDKYSIVDGQYLKILSESVSFIFSTITPEIFEAFINGITGGKNIRISNNLFFVKSVTILKEPIFLPEMEFKTLSPIFQDQKIKNRSEHLSPESDNILFTKYISKSLSKKHMVLLGAKCDSQVEIECIGDVKPKLIRIKEGAPNGSAVKAFDFRFKIKGDPELLKIGYTTGFGRRNAMGFGCVSVC